MSETTCIVGSDKILFCYTFVTCRFQCSWNNISITSL